MDKEPPKREEFLDKKQDYSPYLVHLTKNDEQNGYLQADAKDVLEEILNKKRLIASSHHCLFSKFPPDGLGSQNITIQDLLKVICFTETPLDQIEILLNEFQGRNIKLKPYGLVFTKEYITEKEGNPTFYVNKSLFDSLWTLYKNTLNNRFAAQENKFLALVNRCDESFDFHWEREWRIVGDLKFRLEDVYCGLCPQEDIDSFERRYPAIFIDPHWGINKILDKLEKLSKYSIPHDMPF